MCRIRIMIKKSKYEMKKIIAERCENTSSSQKNEKRSTITKKKKKTYA